MNFFFDSALQDCDEPTGSPDFVEVRDFCFYYGAHKVLHNVFLQLAQRQITALIGPSGCGKSTLLRSINRLNDVIKGTRHEGDILIDRQSVFDARVDVLSLRRRVGMVFQQSNPFPKSVYENVVYPLRVAGRKKKSELDNVAERSLRAAALWDEVKDRLHANAYQLSVGQMQRLCIARAIANSPEIILLDEPCAALDPVSTGKIEELLLELKKDYTLVLVTHNLQQAARVSDRTAFFNQGRLVEAASTQRIFMAPQDPLTQDYVSGRFG